MKPLKTAIFMGLLSLVLIGCSPTKKICPQGNFTDYFYPCEKIGTVNVVVNSDAYIDPSDKGFFDDEGLEKRIERDLILYGLFDQNSTNVINITITDIQIQPQEKSHVATDKYFSDGGYFINGCISAIGEDNKILYGFNVTINYGLKNPPKKKRLYNGIKEYFASKLIEKIPCKQTKFFPEENS